MLTCSCPCAHNEDIWERGGTTPHIINPVLLHNMPLDDILATIFKYDNLPPPQDIISYQMEQVTLSLITYLGIPIFMGYDFWPNLPTQTGTKWHFGTT